MGQKVSPLILRIGYIKNWRSLWYADKKEFVKNIKEDFKIRNYIKKKFVQAAISRVEIERLANQLRIKICSARPGVIIGRRGADIEKLRGELIKMTSISNSEDIKVDIKEIKTLPYIPMSHPFIERLIRSIRHELLASISTKQSLTNFACTSVFTGRI